MSSVTSLLTYLPYNMMNTPFQQAHREARLALLLTLLYLAGWIMAAYWPDSQIGITGFPHWFEAACLLLPLLFILATLLLILCYFIDIPLDETDNE